MAVQNPFPLQKKITTSKEYRHILEQRYRGIEQIIGDGSYVTTTAGGLITSTALGFAAVKGDTNADQGMYETYNDGAVSKTHTADATNPRINRVVLKVDDSAEVLSGPDQGDIVIVPGTPTAGADLNNPAHWPAIPPSAMPIARVRVPNAGAITAADIVDERPKTCGKSIIVAEESRTNAAYGTLATPDQVAGIVVATNGRLLVSFSALMKQSVASAAKAAIFIGANQLKGRSGQGAPTVLEADVGVEVNDYGWVSTVQDVFVGVNGAGDATSVTTGVSGGQPIAIDVAAGTYTVSVQFKASSGSVSAKERKLYVKTEAF